MDVIPGFQPLLIDGAGLLPLVIDRAPDGTRFAEGTEVGARALEAGRRVFLVRQIDNVNSFSHI
jgi:hypothetical protein